MQELVKHLIEKANLSESQAQAAADAVRSFLETKLPDAVKGPVLGLLTGQNVDQAVDKAKELLGGLFGKS